MKKHSVTNIEQFHTQAPKNIARQAKSGSKLMFRSTLVKIDQFRGHIHTHTHTPICFTYLSKRENEIGVVARHVKKSRKKVRFLLMFSTSFTSRKILVR